jgi:hypothetical protein
MIVAYELLGQDNGAHYFEEAPEHFFCQKCGCVVNDSYIPKRLLHLKKSIGDISFTFDNRCIVSVRFKNVCDNYGVSGVDFIEVNSKPLLYLIQPHKELKFDKERRKTLFDEYCKVCNQFTQIIGSSPGFMEEISNPIRKGIFHTDLEFGSYKGKTKSILVSLDIKEHIISENLNGVEFSPVYGMGEKVQFKGVSY